MKNNPKKLIEDLLKKELNIINIEEQLNYEGEWDFCFYPITILKNSKISYEDKSLFEAFNFLLGQLYIFIEAINMWLEAEKKDMKFDMIWDLAKKDDNKSNINYEFYLIEHKK